MFTEEEAQSMHQQWSDMGRSMVEFTAELILKGTGVDVKKRRTTMEALDNMPDETFKQMFGMTKAEAIEKANRKEDLSTLEMPPNVIGRTCTKEEIEQMVIYPKRDIDNG